MMIGKIKNEIQKMEQQCLPWQIRPLQHHHHNIAPTQPPMSTATPFYVFLFL